MPALEGILNIINIKKEQKCCWGKCVWEQLESRFENVFLVASVVLTDWRPLFGYSLNYSCLWRMSSNCGVNAGGVGSGSAAVSVTQSFQPLTFHSGFVINGAPQLLAESRTKTSTMEEACARVCVCARAFSAGVWKRESHPGMCCSESIWPLNSLGYPPGPVNQWDAFCLPVSCTHVCSVRPLSGLV